MNFWQRWLQAPQTHWLRRVLFQLHLWLGIGLGLYVLVIGLSGSALLLQSPFYAWFEPKWVVPTDAEPLKGDELQARMVEVYAGYSVGFTIEGFNPDEATYVVLNRDGEYIPYYFNQYTGESIGPANPWPILAVKWLGDVHDDLLLGRDGRRYNGAGALMFVLMALTGLVLWWQGRARWYEGLILNPWSKRPLLWQLHSFIGFWALLLMLAWGVSGFQLGFPATVNAMLEWFGAEPRNFRQQGGVLGFFRNVHFASYGEGSLARWAWIAASFIPTLMFVTGLWLWWKRVLVPMTSARKRKAKLSQAKTTTEGQQE